MDDKKFNEIMRNYVKSTARGKDADLAKLRASNEQQTKTRKIPRLAWVAISVAIIIAISLSVILPLTLNRPNDDGPRERYLSVGDLELDELQGDADAYYTDIWMPEINSLGKISYAIKLKSSESDIIGIYSLLSIYDEHFDDIDFYAISENNIIDSLVIFESFPDTAEWGDIQLSYKAEYDEALYAYIGKVFFNYNG